MPKRPGTASQKNDLIFTYPWIKKAWKQLEQAYKVGRFSQSLIISGPQNIGLEKLQIYLSRGIICQIDGLRPCNNCNACHLSESLSHPDLSLLGGYNEESPISIDNIRTSLEFLNSKSVISNNKVLQINLNYGYSYSAISAILKILEEPPSNSYLIIRINNSSELPKTIIGRCQVLKINQPDCKTVADWHDKQYSRTIDSENFQGLCATSSVLPSSDSMTDDVHQVAELIINFFWDLYKKKNDFDIFFKKINEYVQGSILDGYELALYMIILIQCGQQPRNSFISASKKQELRQLSNIVKEENLLNSLSYIANIKRLCFNSPGVKASDVSDLIFTNCLELFSEE